MIDAVLSYHMNPLTCGVAKFNHALAKRLGVPCLSCDSNVRYPLISIKASEMPKGPYPTFFVKEGFDLLMHDWDETYANTARYARRVYAASQSIADAIRPHRADVVTAFCPPTIDGNPTRGVYRVLTFGMSHKLALPHFEALKLTLDREHPDYTVELSTAVHEGDPWDDALHRSTEAMRGIFGDRLRVLGFLADDALARLLTEVDAVAAFYTPALRANNTTAWAALAAGKRLYTNRDADSPALDAERYSWDALLKVLA